MQETGVRSPLVSFIYMTLFLFSRAHFSCVLWRRSVSSPLVVFFSCVMFIIQYNGAVWGVDTWPDNALNSDRITQRMYVVGLVIGAQGILLR